MAPGASRDTKYTKKGIIVNRVAIEYGWRWQLFYDSLGSKKVLPEQMKDLILGSSVYVIVPRNLWNIFAIDSDGRSSSLTTCLTCFIRLSLPKQANCAMLCQTAPLFQSSNISKSWVN